MRNILVHSDTVRVAVGSESPVVSVTADAARVVLLHANGRLAVTPLARDAWTVDLGAGGEGDWLHACWVSELEGVFCASRGGSMVMVAPPKGAAAAAAPGALDPAAAPRISAIGRIAHGIRALAWAPDQEVLALATGSDTLLAMTASWAVLNEVPLPPQHPGERHRVSLAWRADGAFICTSSVDADDEQRSLRVWTRQLELHAQGRNEDASAVANLAAPLAWAPDGSLIGAPQAAPHGVGQTRLQISFFERNGLRHGECVVQTGADADRSVVSGVAWNAESDLLAVVVASATAERHDCQLQLYHRSNYHWALKYSRVSRDIAAVRWDQEHPYRLVVVETDAAGTGVLRELEFAWHHTISAEGSCTAAVVDGSCVRLTPFRDAVIPPPLSRLSLRYAQNVQEASFAPPPEAPAGSSPCDLAVLCSDGSCHVQQIVFEPGLEQELNAEDDSAGSLADLLDCHSSALRQLTWLHRAQHAGAADILACICGSSAESTTDRIALVAVCRAPASSAMSLLGVLDVPDAIARIVRWPATDGSIKLMIQTSAAKCSLREIALSGTEGAAFGDELVLGTLPVVCPWISAHRANSSNMATQRDPGAWAVVADAGYVIVAHSRRSQLFVNGCLLSPACSSFSVHEEHGLILHSAVGPSPVLLFTRMSDVLNGVPPAEVAYDASSARLLERGARIVATSAGTDIKVVLQMPRGNLETIAPRALVLASARELLSCRAYSRALELLRRHRVDLNFIVDFDPDAFRENVAQFVSQVNSTNRIDLFLTALRDEDVTISKYPIGSGSKKRDAARPGKVNDIATRTREAIAASDELAAKLTLSMITSYLVQRPPDLVGALSRVRDLALHERSGAVHRGFAVGDVSGIVGADTRDDSSSDESDVEGVPGAEVGLKHVILLSHVDDVYTAALGMYDLSVASLVARKSQKDPKEYVPWLRRLATLPPLLARLEIDETLARHDRVLSAYAALLAGRSEAHLVDEEEVKAAVEHPECPPRHELGDRIVSVARSAGMFQEALSHFPSEALGGDDGGAGIRTTLLLAWAAEAEAADPPQWAHSVAARLAAVPPDHEGALRAARAARDWQSAINIAHAAGMDDAAVSALAASMAAELRGEGTEESRGAAQLLARYAHDIDEATVVLCEIQAFDEAAQLTLAHGRRDLLTTLVLPAALQRARGIADDVRERQAAFAEAAEKVSASRKLRRERLEAAMAEAAAAASGAAGSDEEGEDDAATVGAGSLWSDASSLWSASSATSTLSTASGASAVSAGAFSHISALTLGGISFGGDAEAAEAARRALRRRHKKKHKKRRKKAASRLPPGSAEEEAHWSSVLVASVPPASLLAEARALTLLLLTQGEAAAAQALQRAVRDALRAVHAHPPLPTATDVLLAQGTLVDPQSATAGSGAAGGAGGAGGAAAARGDAVPADPAQIPPDDGSWRVECLL